MSGRRLSAVWLKMIDAYCLHLVASGHTRPTVTLRRGQLSQMAGGLGVPPAKVTPDLLIEWFGQQQHWKSETRRSMRHAARGFFSWAYTTRRLPDHLGDHLPKVRQINGVPRPVPDLAWRNALAAANPVETVILRLAAEAGLRRAEIAKVHVRDLVDSHNGPQLVVHGKGGKTRVVPISHSLAESIAAGPAGHTPELGAFGKGGYLFPGSDNGHLSPQWVGVRISRLLPEGYSIHKLRTRYATRAYRGTRNLRAVQQLLGHASIATTERYTAVDDDEVRATAMAALLSE